jgi:hypothetical protein
MRNLQVYIPTDGMGYWSNQAKEVFVTKMGITHLNDENDFGELRVYFDIADWDVRENGLIYTDNLFLDTLKSYMFDMGYDASDVSYSEQGMQGDNYVSLDVGPKFINSFMVFA